MSSESENSIEADYSDSAPRKQNRRFLSRHERKLSFLAFLSGFAWDGYFLTKISLNEASLVLGLQLVFIAFGIISFNYVESKVGAGKFLKRSVVWIPYVIQFMFGTLFNASLIFFFQSAELSSSWPFLVFLAVVVLGNEIFHRRRDRLTFQVAMFFIAEFLYFVLVIPIVVGKMGSTIFIISGIVSLIVLMIVSSGVSRFARTRFEESRVIRVLVII